MYMRVDVPQGSIFGSLLWNIAYDIVSRAFIGDGDGGARR